MGFSGIRSKVFIYIPRQTTTPDREVGRIGASTPSTKAKKIHEIIGVINRCPVHGSISPPRGGLDGGGSFFAGGLEPAAHT